MVAMLLGQQGRDTHSLRSQGYDSDGVRPMKMCYERSFFQHRVKNGPKWLQTVLFRHDNAPPHRAARVHQFFDGNNFEVVPHAPYSPDLAPRDFWLFLTLKDALRGHTFSSRSALATAIFQWSQRTPKEAFAAAMKKWRQRCEKFVRLQGDYIEK